MRSDNARILANRQSLVQELWTSFSFQYAYYLYHLYQSHSHRSWRRRRRFHPSPPSSLNMTAATARVHTVTSGRRGTPIRCEQSKSLMGLKGGAIPNKRGNSFSDQPHSFSSPEGKREGRKCFFYFIVARSEVCQATTYSVYLPTMAV